MAFQRFIGQRERALSPKVSIPARGLIEFNDGATRKFALNRFNYAILYYEQKARLVGIEFTNNSSEHGAVRVIKKPNGIVKKPNGIVIPAGTFLRQNRILHSQSIMYDVLYSGEHDMYIVQLAHGANLGIRSRGVPGQSGPMLRYR